MSSSTEKLRRLRRMDAATRRKMIKYLGTGPLILVGGLALISMGILLNMDAYSLGGLLVGLGVVIAIVGIVRILIGLINPRSPNDIDPPNPTRDLGYHIFEHD